MNLSSPPSAPSGFISEPPLSPGAAPAAAPISSAAPAPAPAVVPAPQPAAASSPSLEAQVVRLGLMTPDDVATTMREEAETGRTFAELAVEKGRVRAEDLARLMEPAAPAPAPAPLSVVPPPQRAAPEPELAVVPEPTPPPVAQPAPELVPLASVEPIAAAVAEPMPIATVEPIVPAPADPLPEPEPHPELEPSARQEPQPAPTVRSQAHVFVRLSGGERVPAGTFDTQDAAEQRAKELMTAIDSGGEWPRVEGRFVRPDTVVSIDVELAGH